MSGIVGRAAARMWGAAAAAAAVFAFAHPAAALPAYAAQTGEECSACHVGGLGPQLTQHGRIFKIEGYGATQSWAKPDFSKAVPLSGMAVMNFTHTRADQSEPPADHFSRNNNLAVQEVSAFLAGNLGGGVGTFVQATYSGVDRKASLDNVDIRWAREVKLGGKDAVIGATLNNNPTVQDAWNSTPAWGFPYTSSDLAPGKPAVPLIADGLGQQVLGASGYVFLDNHVYAEFGAYRRMSSGLLDFFNLDREAYVSGAAPYWRLAWNNAQGPMSYSVGVFGLDAKLRPDPTVSATDRYRDIGVDATFQRQLPKKGSVALNAAYIHERRRLGASFATGDAAQRTGHLDSFTVDGSYYWNHAVGLTLGLFDVKGSSDSGLFAPEEDVGSRIGKPNTSGFTLQADWTPFGLEGSWGAPRANLRLGVQYTNYFTYNGARRDYDGFGRDAKDNNTLSVFLWTAF